MNLGWFDVCTVIHEFGHMLGMIHEHQASVPIPWNIKNLYKWGESMNWDKEKVNSNILDKYNLDWLNGSKYDPDSIMLYFYAPYLTTNNKGTKENERLSPLDVLWINKMYPTKDPNAAVKFYKKVYGEDISNIVMGSELGRGALSKCRGGLPYCLKECKNEKCKKGCHSNCPLVCPEGREECLDSCHDSQALCKVLFGYMSPTPYLRLSEMF